MVKPTKDQYRHVKPLGESEAAPTETLEYRASRLLTSPHGSERTILEIQTREGASPIYLSADRSALIDHLCSHLRVLGARDERVLEELRKIRQTLEKLQVPLSTEVANEVVQTLDAVYALPRRKE